MAEADGQEVLVVDGDEKVQRGLAQLLADNGLVPTVVSDAVRARELAREKYFAVALIDLDTPQTNAGLELTRWFKANAPTTTTIVMCSRKVFESSVEAFRAGAADVIVKSPDQVQYLRQRTVEVAHRRAEVARRRQADPGGARRARRLPAPPHGSVAQHRRARGAARRRLAPVGRRRGVRAARRRGRRLARQAARERAAGARRLRAGHRRRPAAKRSIAPPAAPSRSRSCATRLPDLHRLDGGLDAQGAVARHAHHPLFAPRRASPGKAEVIEGSKTIPLVPEFSDGKQMVERIDELREAFRRKSRERRYLAALPPGKLRAAQALRRPQAAPAARREVASLRNTSRWPAKAAGTSTVGSQTNGT